MPKILIADDEELIRDMYKYTLAQEGYDIVEYFPGIEDKEIFNQQYDVALLDIVMPGMNGFELRRKLMKKSPGLQSIFISGNRENDIAEQVIEEGGHSFLVKPTSSNQIKTSVYAALHLSNLKRNPEYNAENEFEITNCVNNNACICKQQKKVMDQVLAYAPLNIPILITGESGTGKEIVANCIHTHSERRERKMVSLNCAALSPSLIESELFGHVKGAFTGATQNKEGYFKAAENSTLFLDEIGELPLDLQAKLLRVLDSHEVTPVGSTETHPVNVRVVSATNRNLTYMIKKGLFRSDLYYRLHGTNIRLKSLREESGRIEMIAKSMIPENGPLLTSDGVEYLTSLSWPGNIRELKALMEVLVATCKDKITSHEISIFYSGEKKDLPESKTNLTYSEFRENVLQAEEKKYFNKILKDCRGNISEAARLTGVSRKHLYDKLNKLDLI